MTHPFITASLEYRKAQAQVLREADLFEAEGGKDPAKLLEAVQKMKKAKADYLAEKNKTMAESHDSLER